MLEPFQEPPDRGLIGMRLPGDDRPTLNCLVVRQRQTRRDVLQREDSIRKQPESLLAASVQSGDVRVREKIPAQVMERTGIRIIAVRADRNFRTITATNHFKDLIQLFLDLTAQR